MAIGSAVMAGMSSLGSMFAGSGAAAAAGGTAATAAGGGGMLGSLGGFLSGSTGGFSNAGLLGAGLQGLGLIGNLFGGSDEAKAMKKAQEEQWRQQLIATQEAYKTVADAERSAAKQYHADAISNQASLLQQRAQVALLAGATGTGGNSVSSMLNDLAAEGGRNQSTIIDN